MNAVQRIMRAAPKKPVTYRITGFCSLSKNPNLCLAVAKLQGELEGAKPTSNWIKCPAKPCAARRAESGARIFVLRCRTKIWHYFRLSKSPFGLF